MKLPVSFEQLRKDPKAAIAYIALAAVGFLYYRIETKSETSQGLCEERLTKCELRLERMASSLKTQDSLVASLVSEMNTYKKLGVIQ